LGGALAANEGKIQEAVVAEVVKAFRKQAAIDEIIKKRPPGGFAFASHVLDGQKKLLAVLPADRLAAPCFSTRSPGS
jgi:hypothetical protein